MRDALRRYRSALEDEGDEERHDKTCRSVIHFVYQGHEITTERLSAAEARRAAELFIFLIVDCSYGIRHTTIPPVLRPCAG